MESPELAVRGRSKTPDFPSKIAENLESSGFEAGGKVKCREIFDRRVKAGESGCVAVGLFAREEEPEDPLRIMVLSKSNGAGGLVPGCPDQSCWHLLPTVLCQGRNRKKAA